MSLVDSRANAVSTHSPEALAVFEHAADLTHSYTLDPLAATDDALRLDPQLVMAHNLKSGLFATSTERGALPLLAQSIAAAEQHIERANPRERAHIAAARAWLEGDFAGSVSQYGGILVEHPRDLLALQFAHVGDFLLGASQALRDRPASILPHWDASLPGYGYVLGMYAFGLEEMGAYAQAEDVGREALELNPRDAWAVHAVAHVMEMQGRIREGIEWLTSRQRDWATNNGFAFHNWWHLALYHLDLAEHTRVLELYDAHVHPVSTRVAFENVDASALLWRLLLRGVECEARFAALASDWEAAGESNHYAFNDVHALLAYLGAGRMLDAERVLTELEQAAQSFGTNGRMARDVAVPLGRALLAFRRGAYTECLELGLEVRPRVQRYGGSNAQRDLVHLTLVEAALRAGRGNLAASLTAERTALRPTNPFNWRLTERAAQLRGASDAATLAGKQMLLTSKAHEARKGLRSWAPPSNRAAQSGAQLER
jgi:tetratricopeptide (TPR) repeat protein